MNTFFQRRAFLLLCLVFLTGCVSVQPRPAAWPADVTVTDIHQIEGTFAMGGMVFEVMFEPESVPYEDVRIVAEARSRLSFEIVLPDGTTKKESRPYRIADGWVKVGMHDGTNREGVAGYERLTFAIRPDSTGSLIIKRSGYGIGMALLIPVAGKEENWFRLERTSALRSAAVLNLAGADLSTLAAAWRTNLGRTVSISDQAKAKHVSIDISARTRSEFLSKAITTLRAQGIVVRGDSKGGDLFDALPDRNTNGSR